MSRDVIDRVVVMNCFVGIAHMQVCASKDATDEEILEVCNRENPSGTTCGWSEVRKANDEFWGETAPVQCAEHEDRVHYLVSC